MIKKIIITTSEPNNYVPLNLKKSGEELGIDVQILDISKTVLIEELLGNSPETFNLNSGVFSITDDGNFNKIEVDNETSIIPRLNEHHTMIKLGILKRLESQGAPLLNSAESMELCNNKLMTQIVLNSSGIKTPFSVMIQGIDEIDKVTSLLEKQNKIKYPFVIKTFRGTHGIGVMKVDSHSSLVSVAQLLNKENVDFMLQEFCAHEKSARIIMIGDKMLAANLRGQPKDKEEFRTNSHLGSETDMYQPSEEEISVCKKIVELFGCNFCAIDYLITENKEIIVLEVNGSPGLENIQSNWPDKNLTKEIIQYIIGNQEAEVSTVISQDSMIEPEKIESESIGETEIVSISRIIQDVEARIDTGAKYCSLHVDNVEVDGDWVKFTKGDITYKVAIFKNVKIRHASIGESVLRPVVKLDLIIRDVRLNQIEFTLNNRSSMSYPVLIGRNALQALGLPVIVYTDSNNSIENTESIVYDMNDESVEEE